MTPFDRITQMGKERRSAQSHDANRRERRVPAQARLADKAVPKAALKTHSPQGENTPFGAKKERSQNRVFSDMRNTTVI